MLIAFAGKLGRVSAVLIRTDEYNKRHELSRENVYWNCNGEKCCSLARRAQSFAFFFLSLWKKSILRVAEIDIFAPLHFSNKYCIFYNRGILIASEYSITIEFSAGIIPDCEELIRKRMCNVIPLTAVANRKNLTDWWSIRALKPCETFPKKKKKPRKESPFRLARYLPTTVFYPVVSALLLQSRH